MTPAEFVDHIAKQTPKEDHSFKVLRVRCALCEHVWLTNTEPHHSANCAWLLAVSVQLAAKEQAQACANARFIEQSLRNR